MSRTITGGQNINEDVTSLLLLILDNARISQGILTCCAAIIAATAALIVAYRAYPRQKEIDHLNEIKKERREAYRKYIREIADTQLAISRAKFKTQTEASESFRKIVEVTGKLRVSHTELGVIASPKVYESAQSFTKCIVDLAKAWQSITDNGKGPPTFTPELSSQLASITKSHQTNFRKAIKNFQTEIRNASFSDNGTKP